MTDRFSTRNDRLRSFLVSIAGQAAGLIWIGALMVVGWFAGLAIRRSSAITPQGGRRSRSSDRATTAAVMRPEAGSL